MVLPAFTRRSLARFQQLDAAHIALAAVHGMDY